VDGRNLFVYDLADWEKEKKKKKHGLNTKS
jgi:hypothetical protein